MLSQQNVMMQHMELRSD